MRSYAKTLLCALCLIASAAFADGITGCHTLLSTSVGYQGALSVTLDRQGNLTILRDGYSRAVEDEVAPLGDGRVPRWRKVQASILLPNRSLLRAFSSLPDAEGGAFYASVNRAGFLTLVLPDERSISVQLPLGAKALSTAFFREPVQSKEEQWTEGVPVLGGSPRDAEVEGGLRGRLRRAEKNTPIHFFVAAKGIVYESVLRYRRVLDESIARALISGFVDVYTDTPDADNYPRWKNREPFLDFSDPNILHRVLMPTSDPEFALEVSSFRTVSHLPGNFVLQSPDFLQAISATKLVVGSRIGQVLRLDLVHKTIGKPLGFSEMVELESLSAHTTFDGLQLWAVDKSHSQLFHWHDGQVAPYFKRVEDFPAADPRQVASFAAPIPASYSIPFENGAQGYLSNYHHQHQVSEVERILVLGADGRLHALRDRPVVGQMRSAREWISLPLLDPVPD